MASPSREAPLHDWEVEIHPESVQHAHDMPMLLEWLFGVAAWQVEAAAREQLLLSSPVSPEGRGGMVMVVLCLGSGARSGGAMNLANMLLGGHRPRWPP